MSTTTARNWFESEQRFRQVCGDAKSMARGESAEEFAAKMVEAANRHGLDVPLSPKQLKWLCELADIVPPQRLA